MKILVGTENKRKIASVKKVVEVMKIFDEYSVAGCKAKSLVSGTPLNAETKKGAINRAKNAQQCDSECEMYIGVESGLVERYEDFFEEVWVAILYRDEIYTAYSSGVKLPKCVSSHLKGNVENMRDIREQKGIEICKTLGVDTWGDYTGGKIAREVGIEEALRNTLVQIFPEEKSFYNYE